MPEIIRSLIVVLFIASGIFYFARKYAVQFGCNPALLSIRIKAWYLITCAAFLSHNFWLFACISAVVLWRSAKQDSNPFALAMSVLFAVPFFSMEIPGAGIVNYLFRINFFQILVIVICLPLLFKIRKDKSRIPMGRSLIDKFVLMYVIYVLILSLPYTTLTNAARILFLQCLNIIVPYYVASRYLKTREQVEDVLRMLVLASLVVGVLGAFENIKGWILYDKVSLSLGGDYGMGYLKRGELLRAAGTTGQPIVLGYIMAVATGVYYYVSAGVKSGVVKYSVYVALLLGLYAPISRGPWVGAALMFLFVILFEPAPATRLMRILVRTIVPLAIVLMTPAGQSFVDKLPIIGTVDPGSVEFRQDLLSNAIEVIQRNPWFGSPNYLESEELESMRAGGAGGIVDIVNSYIAVALSGGLVGLAIFAGFFVSQICLLYGAMKRTAFGSIENKLYVTLLSCVLGIAFTVYTVSSISFIPIIYWIMGGIVHASVYLSSSKNPAFSKKSPATLRMKPNTA